MSLATWPHPRVTPGGTRATSPETSATRRLLPGPVGPYLLVGDVVAYVGSLLLAERRMLPHLVGLLVLLICYRLYGLYRSRLTLSVLDDLPYLLRGVAIAWVAELAAHSAFLHHTFTRDLLPRMFLLLGLVVAVRAVAYFAVRCARRTGRVRYTALVLGAGHVGMRLVKVLEDHREYGLDPIGFVDSRPPVQDGALLPVPLLGGYQELAVLLHEHGVDVVLVAFGSMREADLVEVLRTCDRMDCEIFFVPRLFEIHTVTRDMDEVWGVPLVRVRRSPFRKPTWRVKRLVDIAFAALALVVLAPLLLLIALAVRLESGPGFLFRQERVGLDGRLFQLLKFRSLRPLTTQESATLWNVRHDDRLGPVGRFLRRTSLDELPQLWNVLRGDMSLVGPRPERQHFVEKFTSYVPRYTARHRVPAGLTGWAQVHGLRGDTSIEDRASFDNHYIENWSLWGDVKIMVRTLDQVVRTRGG